VSSQLNELAHFAAWQLQRGTVVALTGAGISVESGISDFRSPEGLWTIYAPEVYASIDTFYRSPDICWEMFRALAQSLQNKQHNSAHLALAEMDSALPITIVTQNIDGLHQTAGSTQVLEIHGDHHTVQCQRCGFLGPFLAEYLLPDPAVPICPQYGYPLKPYMVLFGEDVRHLDEIHQIVDTCSLMLVIGTSANVYPASELPARACRHGAIIIEFNLETTALTRGEGYLHCQSYALVQGPAAHTVPLFCKHLIQCVTK